MVIRTASSAISRVVVHFSVQARENVGVDTLALTSRCAFSEASTPSFSWKGQLQISFGLAAKENHLDIQGHNNL